MMAIVAIFLILLGGGWIGFSILPEFIESDSGFEVDGFEYIPLLLIGGLTLFGWFAIVLAELSLFSIWSLFIVFVVLVGLGALSARFQGRSYFSLRSNLKQINWNQPAIWGNGLPNYFEIVFVGIWLLILLPIYMRPHQAIVGAADVGVYINLASYLNRTGGLIVESEVLAELDPAIAPAFLRQMPESSNSYDFWSPGLLVPAEDGRILPPFYHLQSVWQAVGIALGGLSAGLLLTPMWGLLSNLTIYLVVRRLIHRHSLSQWVALVTLSAISITTLQVWFSRYGTAEALTQFLLWGGLWGFIRWTEGDYKSYVWGGLAGIAWGMTFLTRIDTFFILAIPGILLFLLIIQRKWRSAHLAFFIPLVILPIHSILHALAFSEPYFYIVFGYVLLVGGRFLPYLIIGGVGLLILAWIMSAKWSIPSSVMTGIKLLLGISFISFFLYNLWLRPEWEDALFFVNPWDNIPTEHWNHVNLVRLKWYLSPIGLWGAFFGILFLIKNLKEKSWALIVMGLMFTFLYIWDIRSNGIHIYSQRRYVPMVIPFFIVATGLFLNWFVGRFQRVSRFILPIFSAIWLLGLLTSTVYYSRQTDFRGLPAQIETLAETFPENSILLFNQNIDVGIGDFLVVPLFFIHGHDGFVLKHLDQIELSAFEKALEGWNEKGYSIYWIVEGNGHSWPLNSQALEFKSTHLFETTQLESVPDRQPTEIFPIVWQVEVYEVAPQHLR